MDFQKTPHDQLKSCSHIDETKLSTLLKVHKLATDEYQVIKDILKRPPTMAELGVFSAMWSEHCSYKSSRIHLKKLPTEAEHVVMGPGENAGVVEIDGDLCVAFKMESHNHPSYIEPYQGAATGVGGILRDVFCMGARPIANVNCLRFGQRSHPKTAHLLAHVVKGIGDYGNCVGIPTVAGNISFDECYDGNCLVNAMTVGTIHKERIFTGHASGHGNYVVYVGSATGRDGIHGATMASDSFDSAEAEDRGAVQVGDPFKEKLLLEVTLELLERGLVLGLQDMGAAGLTSSAFEMADRGQSGLYLDLDRVPVRTQNMTAYELLLSESQERMLMVIEPQHWQAACDVFEKWALDYNIIGTVTDTQRVEIVKDQTLEVNLPVAPLTERAPKYDRPAETSPLENYSKDEQLLKIIKDRGWEETLAKLAGDVGDKDFIYEQYDTHIGTQTALGPAQQGAAVVWLRSSWTNKKELGLAVSSACNESYTYVDPYRGGAHAVLKAARAIAATGSQPLASTDCLNYGNPEDPRVMGDFVSSLDGVADACRQLNTPIVSGNVSFYNETDGKSIAPTPMIGMVGKHQQYTKARGAVLTESAHLFLLTPQNAHLSFAGSLAEKVLDKPEPYKHLPDIQWDYEKAAMTFLQAELSGDSVIACRDVGQGGIVTALFKMVAGRNFVTQVHLPTQTDLALSFFGEHSGAYIIASRDPAWATNLDKPAILDLGYLGQAMLSSETDEGQGFTVNDITFDITTIEESLRNSLLLS